MTLPKHLDNTDLCVMCGMCLPGCPTYQIHKIEAESPRGRIALIQAIKNGKLTPDENTLEHLNHCLGCLACEAMCPSKVPYGQLIDEIKQETSSNHKKPLVLRTLLKINEQAGGLARFQTIYNILRKPIFNRVTHIGLKLAKQQATALNTLITQSQTTRTLDNHYPASTAKAIGSVGLFSGCMSRSFDKEVLQSSIHLLNRLGYNVYIPDNQFCCGAMHQHNGEIHTANQLLDKNKNMFQRLDIDALLYTASACGSQLCSSDFAMPVEDIRHFLFKHLQKNKLSFETLDQNIMVHESCSSKNALKSSGISRQLLALIPGISLSEFEQPDLCCGAGGSQQILYPDQASALLSKKIDTTTFQNNQYKYLVSDNLSCALHFKAGISERYMEIEATGGIRD